MKKGAKNKKWCQKKSSQNQWKNVYLKKKFLIFVSYLNGCFRVMKKQKMYVLYLKCENDKKTNKSRFFPVFVLVLPWYKYVFWKNKITKTSMSSVKWQN